MTDMTGIPPVDPATLAELVTLQDRKSELALANLQLDEKKILILAASASISAEIEAIHRKILEERGIAPNTDVSVDVHSGVISLEV